MALGMGCELIADRHEWGEYFDTVTITARVFCISVLLLARSKKIFG